MKNKHDDDVEALTKRFRDYIDRVQSILSSDEKTETESVAAVSSGEKLYTVISPVKAMTKNLQSVMDAIDSAIETLDRLAVKPDVENEPDAESGDTQKEQDVYVSSPGKEVFTREELDYLMMTFNDLMESNRKKKSPKKSPAQEKNRPPK